MKLPDISVVTILQLWMVTSRRSVLVVVIIKLPMNYRRDNGFYNCESNDYHNLRVVLLLGTGDCEDTGTSAVAFLQLVAGAGAKTWCNGDSITLNASVE
jgi:hypothetical protein